MQSCALTLDMSVINEKVREARLCDLLLPVQVISLGVHIVHDDFPAAMLLMEVMPSLLASRCFPRPRTERVMEPGYRDSPHPSAVALVFIKVCGHMPGS